MYVRRVVINVNRLCRQNYGHLYALRRKGMDKNKREEERNTDKGRRFSLLEIQSLSANSLTCIPNKLFHIRVLVDYYRLLQNIPFSMPH